MADEKKETKQDSGVTEAEIMKFREHLGIKDHEEEEPLFGKMEQMLDAFSKVDSQDILNALNSISEDDDEDN
ncbi:MAG: hypothetical protein DUD27_04345 [Lachnospiraceae bacterium]|uniref:Uncharacterized protein n=1 Tax=Candidatus Weimeria bifida TaxID=2599074 RepID=A0A6N7J149_9FIRM|nr:hypothetical protein [Candidatus Weimeria bifida]RRF96571.1 MAG: hypothetical protein DUD27_04345 [Lachnospiraceae bacterium]